MAAEWTVTLNTGAKMPAFGLGTWLSKVGEAGAAVEAALKAGYRSIDCAHFYQNEGEIGESLQRCFKEGVVKREDIFVTSKLAVFDTHPELTEAACRLTLKNLQLDYLNLYLIHAPFPLKVGNPQNLLAITDDDKLGYDADRIGKVWEVMESLVSKGLVKAIGISNFTITKTENLLKTAKIVPAVNQVEIHPFLQQPKLKQYCDSKGIVLEAYSPLGNPGRPARTRSENDPNPLEDPVIGAIAAKHSVTPAQICIAFPLHRGMVVIPKSVTPTRIAENIKATGIKLDAEDMKQLTGLDRNHRLLTFKIMNKTGSTLEEIWDMTEDEAFLV